MERKELLMFLSRHGLLNKVNNIQVSQKIGQLKFITNDDKYYFSDAADTETMFRIIQSITVFKRSSGSPYSDSFLYRNNKATLSPVYIFLP